MKKLTNFKFQSVICKLLSVIFLSVCIIFSICVYHSFADVPCKINYQGRLIKDNVPVHNPTPGVPMIFTVDGIQVYTGDVPVYNGLFRVVLDLEGIDWTAGEVLYLEVTVDGEQLTPPEPIYAYPYAINTHFLEGHTTAHFLDVSGSTQTKKGGLNIEGNVGIGTTEPQAKLHVGGTPGTDGIMFPDGRLQTTAGGVPAGSVISYMGTTVPHGWLECNGSSVLKINYPTLFNAIGYMYGGSGSSFNLPDLRGYFLRGWDHGAGRDPDAVLRTNRGDGTTGDVVGTKQDDEFERHVHTETNAGVGSAGSGNTDIQGYNGAADGAPFTANQQTLETGGNETRPKNIYVMYIIKAE